MTEGNKIKEIFLKESTRNSTSHGETY